MQNISNRSGSLGTLGTLGTFESFLVVFFCVFFGDLGELFVYIEIKNSEHSFLSLPDMKIRNVPLEKFEFGLKEKIIDIIRKLPKNVYDTCIKQYNKNSANIQELIK